MFADNDCISHRQLLRQMILAFLGAWLLFLAGESCRETQNGLFGMLLGLLLLAGWSLLLLDGAKVYQDPERYIGKTGRRLVTAFYLSFLVLTGSFLLERISGLCGEYLVGGVSPKFLGLLLLAAAGIGVGNDIQRRARLAEIFYPLVMTGFVLLLLLAVFHMRPESFERELELSAETILQEGWRTLGAGAALSVLPFILGQVDRKNRIVRPLLEGMGKLWILVTAAVVILIGTFGEEGVRRMEQPVLQLMAGTRLPGEFLERFDIVWLALLLCSALFAIGSILFYGNHLVKLKEEGGRIFRFAMAAAVYGGSVIGADNGIAQWYPKLTERFYLPVFLGLSLLLWLAGKWKEDGQGKRKPQDQDQPRRGQASPPETSLSKTAKTENRAVHGAYAEAASAGNGEKTENMGGKRRFRRCLFPAMLLIPAAVLLTGCGGIGPEERAYPLTIMIDRVPEGYQVIYDLADLAQMTGQGKQGDGGENGGSTGTAYTAEELKEIGELYDACSQYELDTGHVKAVIFGTALLNDRESVETVMEWLETDRDLGRNALVFQADQPSAVMEKREDLGDSIGVFLTGLYENREHRTRHPVTLDDVFYRWYNDGTFPELPRVTPADKGLECE